MRDIFRSEGTFGLYRGHSATILRIFPYAAIKFVAYEQIRNVVIPSKDKETPIRRLVSGSLAGVTSVFFTYPLEVIRVRLAFETRKDQPRASLSSIVKRIYNEHPPAPSPPPSISTLPATSAATQTLQSAARATVESVQQITPRAGLANFYRGFSATIMGMLPYAGMSFLTHDTAQDILRSPLLSPYTTLPPSSPLRQSQDPHKPPPLRTYAELTAGGLAGLVSQTASYPLEVVRRRMQVGGAVGDGRRLTVREVGRRIWRERGWRGYWVGLSIGYVKVVPMVAVSFWVYERGKGWLGI
jgi:solute carrier family 25 protein 16